MDTPNFEEANQYALQRLENELSPNLIYHGISHTRDDVVPTVQMLAEREDVPGDLRSLLVTAAWFHDLGYIEVTINHETVSARMASEVLPEFGFTPEQVDILKGMIMATVIPQTPRTHLEQILADADLDMLGRDDFVDFNNKLRRELALLGEEYVDSEWYSRQLEFLESHTYFTAAAHALRDAGQSKNIRLLEKLLEGIKSRSE